MLIRVMLCFLGKVEGVSRGIAVVYNAAVVEGIPGYYIAVSDVLSHIIGILIMLALNNIKYNTFSINIPYFLI